MERKIEGVLNLFPKSRRSHLPGWLSLKRFLTLILMCVMAGIALSGCGLANETAGVESAIVILPAATIGMTATQRSSSTATSTMVVATFTLAPSSTLTSTASVTSLPDIGSSRIREADGMLQVYVPEGEFMMGSNEGDLDEQPVHAVYLDAYWIDQTEVTNAMFALCVQSGVCDKPICDTYEDSAFAAYPVGCITWEMAKLYCAWAGSRLPTEAEWEKAARGLDGRKYPWGNNFADQSLLNYGQYEEGAVPVGSYPEGASPYGALDMAGNVWEWVADWYDEGYYVKSNYENTQGPPSGTLRSVRGGAYDLGERYARTSHRLGFNPVGMFSSNGFRCLSSP